MKKSVVRKMVMAAMFAALAFILDYVFSIKTAFSKFTIYGLPLILCGMLCGWHVGALAGLVEGFIIQAIGSYGLTITTPLWMLAPMCWGLVSGLLFKIIKTKNYYVNIILTIIITSLFVTGINTGAMILDGIIMNYSYAYVFTSLVSRILISLAISVFYCIVVCLVLKRLNMIIYKEEKSKKEPE